MQLPMAPARTSVAVQRPKGVWMTSRFIRMMMTATKMTVTRMSGQRAFCRMLNAAP